MTASVMYGDVCIHIAIVYMGCWNTSMSRKSEDITVK